MKFLFATLLFQACTLLTTAQQKEFVFKNFTQEEGLPSNEAYFIFEDSKHYIWIATDLGIVRYNGKAFEQFQLPDNVIFKIQEDHSGRIWFFSHSGQLAYFENEKIYPFRYNREIAKRISRLHIIESYIDSDYNIYFNSAIDSNYIVYKNGTIKAIDHEAFNSLTTVFDIEKKNNGNLFTTLIKRSLHNSRSYQINVKQNNSWIHYSIPINYPPYSHYGAVKASNNDIYFFYGKLIVHLKADGTSETREMPSNILCIYPWKNKLWIGTINYGAFLLNHELATLEENVSLSRQSVTSITTDYEGGLWFSTLEHGIYYSKNTNIVFLKTPALVNSAITRTFNLHDSLLLFTQSNNINKYDGKKIDVLLKENLLNANNFILKDRILFFFGEYDSFSKVIKVREPDFDFIHLLTSPANGILVGHDTFIYSRSSETVLYQSYFLLNNKKVILHYDSSRTKKILNSPARLFKSSNNTIWAATNDGLYRSYGNYDTLLKTNPSSTLLSNGVSCLQEPAPGIIAAGVRSKGIALIKNDSILAVITEKEGLLSNKIRHMLIKGNQLWAATAKGISIIHFSSFYPLQYNITNIGKDDGFYNLTIYQLTSFKNSIVAATNNGIYFIENPDQLIRRNFTTVPFYINSITAGGRDTNTISNLFIAYQNNRLVIRYNAISFSSYEDVYYQYRFLNNDTGWHSTLNTELLLDNLEPGDYILELKAVIPDQGRTSEIKSLQFTIGKPWWQNNWLRLSAVLLVAGAVYYFVRNRIRKIKEEEESKTALNAKLTELEQTALRSQMNPHFIFNCLTSIQQLIVSGQKTDANEYLVKFARLIRKTLDLSAHPFISITDEKDYLEEYLVLEQLRLSGQFDFCITQDEHINPDKTFIPNMMIQPIAENCIRHGIKALEDRKGHIDIHFIVDDKNIICTVTDNGTGRQKSSTDNTPHFTKHKSYGVDITRKRLEKYSATGQVKTGIIIEDLFAEDGMPAGTKVTIHLPFKTQI